MIVSLPKEGVKYLLGDGRLLVRPLTPYCDLVCDFLDELSRQIKAHPEAARYPDVMTFAFWCRKGNLLSLKKAFEDDRSRLGVGMVFHVTPSNVPIHFAFSYAFGLLAGNANVVRVPSKEVPQVDVLVAAASKVFESGRFEDIKRMTAWVRYAADAGINGRFSAECRARMVWGGDDTVAELRRVPMPARSTELVFPDRYSLCVLDGPSITKLSNGELEQLAGRFFNDAFLMDQNACSSPHLVIWMADQKREAQGRFWACVSSVAASKLPLAHIQASEKYLRFCEDAIELDASTRFARFGNHVYLATLGELPRNLERISGRFGYFYQYEAAELSELVPILSAKIQTLTFFGTPKSELLELILKNRLTGVDRIVPVGKALDIGVVWDGFDVVGSLSRIIEVA